MLEICEVEIRMIFRFGFDQNKQTIFMNARQGGITFDVRKRERKKNQKEFK